MPPSVLVPVPTEDTLLSLLVSTLRKPAEVITGLSLLQNKPSSAQSAALKCLMVIVLK